MAAWAAFAAEAPELAAFGAERLGQGTAFLATVRRDGSPRVHPVSPIIGGGRLFIFMEPTSPKGGDLRRDPRYALHSLVVSSDGAGGEFVLRGEATPVADGPTRALAAGAAGYTPQDRYVLFELSVGGAASTVYDGGEPVRTRWGTP